jgi:stalled ribosome rescue protein Dom34
MIAPLLTAIKDDSWKASSNSDWANEVSSELDPDHAKAIWYAEKYPDKAVKMIFEDDNLSKALLASVKFSTMKSTASKLKDYMKDNAVVARMIGDGTGITDLVDMEIINKMIGDISITPAQSAERRLRWDAENEELIRMQRTLLPGQGLKSYME